MLIDRSEEIKKEVVEILADNLEDLMGIYLCGSWARGEQTKDSDIDIFAISEKTSKKISSGKYNIEIYPLESVKKTIKENPIMIVPRIIEAKAILNNKLLDELRRIKIKPQGFSDYLKACERAVKINQELLEGMKETFPGVIYSLILRLRGLYFISLLKNNKKYSQNKFIKWLKLSGLNDEEIEIAYSAYQNIKNDNKFKGIIPLKIGSSLIDFIKKELKNDK